MVITEPTGPERLGAQPEQPPLSAEEQALLDALTPPAGVLQDWQQRFDTVVGEVIDSQLDPRQKQIFRAVADRVGWEWFGQPGEALPETLVLYRGAASGTLHVRYRPDIAPAYRLPQHELHLQTRLKPIIEERKTFFSSKYNEVVAATGDIIRTGPQYRLFQGFLVESPDKLHDLPLTSAWRGIREAQIKEEVRRNYGVAASDELALRSYSPAGRALQQGFSRLDDETMPRPEKAPSDEFSKLHNWLLGEAQDWISGDEELQPGERVVDFVARLYTNEQEKPGREFCVKTSAGNLYPTSDECADWSSELCNGEYPREPLAVEIRDQFLGYWLLHELYWRNDATRRNVPIALERAVEMLAHDEMNSIMWGNEPDIDVLLTLRRPTGPIYTEFPEVDERTRPLFQESSESVTIHDQESVERQRWQVAGEVIYRDTERDVQRLITAQHQNTQYPTRADNYDLILQFKYLTEFSVENSVREPFIPGFRIVARNGDRWSFVRTETDPYTGADNITIAQAGISRLQTIYQQLGLQELGDKLAQHDQLSVLELERLISNNSDYTNDITLGLDQPGRYNKPTFESFKSYVVDGRLQAQCTGAASFLALSLEAALPGAVSRQIGGRILRNQNLINEIGHAQTLLTFQGQQYILDATPPGPGGADLGTGDGAYRTEGLTPHQFEPHSRIADELVLAKAPVDGVPDIDLSSLSTTTLSEIAESYKEVNALSRRQQLEHALQVILEVPNGQALYQKVVALSRADPIRRSLEAVIKSSRDNQDDVLVAARDYLARFSQADAATRKRLNLPDYDAELVTLLDNILAAS